MGCCRFAAVDFSSRKSLFPPQPANRYFRHRFTAGGICMTAQNRPATTFQAIHAGAPRRGRDAATRAVFAAALMGCMVPAVGCKTGTSFTKPSWLTFGGTPKADADALAAAPPYGGEIKKPSESAKQYPTTSTPSGYVITGSTSPTDAVAQQFQATQPQAPVVYGSTPPPSMAATAAAATPPSAIAQQPTPSTIAPQVGPYAPLASDSIPPPGQPLPPISPSTTPSMAGASGASGLPGAGMASMPSMNATPAETAMPSAAYSNFSAPTASPISAAPPAGRMADARAADPAAAIPAAALPAEQPAYGGSRYSASMGSRFGGTEAASFSPAGAYPPASPAASTESGFAAPAAAAPLGAPPSVSPPASTATPGLLQPSAQPVRRPDPGYRPGGTSSYRPSRTILADESAPTASAAVRTASYEEPAVTIQQ